MKNFVIPTLDSPNAETLSDYLNSSIEAFSDITGIAIDGVEFYQEEAVTIR